MVRESLLAGALLVVAAPVVAQEEWTSHRPDGHAPFGVTGGRVLTPGELEATYRFVQIDSRGIWNGTDSLRLAQVHASFLVAPRELSDQAHNLAVAYGVTPRVSVFANLSFRSLERQELDRSANRTIRSVNTLGDMELAALYEFITEGPYVAHVQMGALLPTGSFDPGNDSLTYDMRPGSGSFGFTPGLTVQTQNERGSVGAQVKGRMYLGNNGSNFKVGNRVEGSTWIGLRINEYFSFSARVRFESWGRISGVGDPQLVAIEDNSATPVDPGNNGSNQAGSGTDVLVGINFYIPEQAHLGGSRLAVEVLTPASRSYSGPQLGRIGGIIVGWQMTF